MGIFRNLLDIASGPLGAPCGLFCVPGSLSGVPCSLSGVHHIPFGVPRVPFGVPCNPFGVPQILFGVVRGDISQDTLLGLDGGPHQTGNKPHQTESRPRQTGGRPHQMAGGLCVNGAKPRGPKPPALPELPMRVGTSRAGWGFPRRPELPALTRFPAQRGGFPGASHAGRSFLHRWGLPATLRTSRSGLRAWRTGLPGWFAPGGPPARPARRPARHPARRGCCRPPGMRGWGSRGS